MYARRRLKLQSSKSLYYACISNTNPRKSSEFGSIFEALVFKLVEDHGGLKCVDFDGNKHPSEVQKGGAMVQSGTGLCKRMCDMMKGMHMLEKGSSKSVFVGINFPVIDFADAHNRGFSITISRHKQINEKMVNKLRARLGLQKDTVLHLVLVFPESFSSPAVPFNNKDVKWYKCQIPSPDKWQEFAKLASSKYHKTTKRKKKRSRWVKRIRVSIP